MPNFGHTLAICSPKFDNLLLLLLFDKINLIIYSVNLFQIGLKNQNVSCQSLQFDLCTLTKPSIVGQLRILLWHPSTPPKGQPESEGTRPQPQGRREPRVPAGREPRRGLLRAEPGPRNAKRLPG